MVPCFPLFSTHATPASQGVSSPHQIVTSKDLSPSSCPNKESNPSWSFHPPNGFPRKMNVGLTNKSLIEGFRSKSTMLPKRPLHDIRALMPWNFRMNEIKKGQNLIHLPIIKIPNKREIPDTLNTLIQPA
jgi:hypothetical protein